MPKTYGLKEKDTAVAYVLDRLLSGRLRSGDRVDRKQMVIDLGISRIPIQEAIVQLEHDGILKTEYHRGVFVERFDADIVREHYEVYGLLSGVSAARAAAAPTPRVLHELHVLLDRMRENLDSADFEDCVWAFRRTLNHEYAGPRLRAGIRASQSFMPKAFWVSYVDNQAVMLPYYEQEYRAIRRRDPRVAREACAGRSATMAEIVITELVRRGVFPPDETNIDPQAPGDSASNDRSDRARKDSP